MNYYDNIKLEIYEAYDNGEISYDEKEYLLEEVNEVIYEDSKDVFKAAGIGAAIGGAIGAFKGYKSSKKPKDVTMKDVCIEDFNNTSEGKKLLTVINTMYDEILATKLKLDRYCNSGRTYSDKSYGDILKLNIKELNDKMQETTDKYNEKLKEYLDEHLEECKDDPEHLDRLKELKKKVKSEMWKNIGKSTSKSMDGGFRVGLGYGVIKNL